MAYNVYDDINIPDYQVLLFLWDREGNEQEKNTRNFVVDISNILVSSIQIGKERNKPDNCSIEIEYEQFKQRLKNEGTYTQNVLKPWLTELKITRNFQTVFDGYISSMKLTLGEVGQQSLLLQAFDWSKMLEKRFVSTGYGDMTYPQIAQQLIMDAQHEINWIENYAFEASDEEAYFSGWACNGNPDPDEKSRPKKSEIRKWNGGIKITAGTTIQTSTQGANDYAGEKLKFSCWYKGGTTLTLTTQSGIWGSLSDISSKSIILPNSTDWEYFETTFTMDRGNVTYLKFQTSNTIDITEISLYRDFVEGGIYDLGIRPGVIDATDTHGGKWPYRKDRIRHYHRQRVLDALYNLSKLQADANDGDQFEYLIDENKKFNCYKYYGNPIADPAAMLVYPGQIKTLSIQRDIDEVNNLIVGVADEDVSYKDAEGNERNYTRKWSTVKKDMSSIMGAVDLLTGRAGSNLGVLMELKSYDGVDEQQDIDDKVIGDLNSFGDIQEVPTLTVDSNVYNPSNIKLGDAVAIKVLDDDLFTYINDVYRVYSLNLSVSPNSVEVMSVELITPSRFTIQLMSFVDKFKLTAETLRRLQVK